MVNKKMGNPLELRAIIHFDENGHHIDIAKVCYTMTCEHGLNEPRMSILLENAELRRCVKDFMEEAVAQVDIHEEIAEEDSLIEYPRPTQ